jgi:hypothetical protein
MNNKTKETDINEGQTQVYMSGMIEPQYGVDTNAPYLNTPPKQLLDLISPLYKSGKSDSQILAILVGMGVQQQLALAGISAFKSMVMAHNENNQKNHNKMKFTLTNLYENVMKSIDTLKVMKSDRSRISYSAATAINVLENSLKMFPHGKYADYITKNSAVNSAVTESDLIDYKSDKYALVQIGEMNNAHNVIPIFVGQSTGILVQTGNDETALIEKSKQMLRQLSVKEGANPTTSFKVIELTPAKIEEINSLIERQKSAEDTSIDINSLIIKQTMNEDNNNPNLKFKIAKTLHRELNQYDWLLPVQELRSYINDMYNVSKWSFKISEAIERNGAGKGALVESLINDLTETLKESTDVKGKFTKVASKYPWSSDVKSILNEMSIEDKKAVSNNAATATWVLSPVLENENGLNFFLHGKTYAIKEGQITESVVTDQRFFNVLEGLNLFKHKDNKLVVFGRDDKSLEYDLSEGTLMMGNTNLTELTPAQIKESLLSTNFFGYKLHANADKVAKFFESIDLLHEMDNFTNLSSNEFLNLYLTVIAVEEGYWVNKVNNSMKLNEMVFIPTATDAVKTIKEFINYDMSLVLSDRLVAEGDKEAQTLKLRSEIAEKIQFLEEKKVKVNEAIKLIGQSEELQEALKLINTEISKFEKELQETYMPVTEKKTKSQYLNDGYVEANVFKATNELKKGQKVMVSAEEYASLGDTDLLTVIDPNNENEIIVKKADLKVEI